ncbi:hypothetical protein BGW36DRAFT_354558 [Talaromyces proteolyticus]|uniref:Uncharacterized protein n=1 Tax=Talaromyces proteolyticus TaxID=1131652 RepID=A0AAD4L095_9EURO|nr:uncharacterized protein BGW36DRAFT_354558 [Talaromyces proteolyticus]KAH8703125.1 hypothetical protein BGW36DRAFT_354558 [Talaromyces proteolyticus]
MYKIAITEVNEAATATETNPATKLPASWALILFELDENGVYLHLKRDGAEGFWSAIRKLEISKTDENNPLLIRSGGWGCYLILNDGDDGDGEDDEFDTRWRDAFYLGSYKQISEQLAYRMVMGFGDIMENKTIKGELTIEGKRSAFVGKVDILQGSKQNMWILKTDILREFHKYKGTGRAEDIGVDVNVFFWTHGYVGSENSLWCGCKECCASSDPVKLSNQP